MVTVAMTEWRQFSKEIAMYHLLLLPLLFGCVTTTRDDVPRPVLKIQKAAPVEQPPAIAEQEAARVARVMTDWEAYAGQLYLWRNEVTAAGVGEAFERRDYARGMELLIPLAEEKQNPLAQSLLGEGFENGRGIGSADPAKALVWHQRAAALGFRDRMGKYKTPPISPAQRVVSFVLLSGISSWPRLDGCEYDRSFADATVGLILDIDSVSAGTARWGGCQVPRRHELTGVPPELAPGRYVVAATSSESDQERLFTNRQLKILAILGAVPNNPELFDAALAQICTPVAANKETDRDCRDRNRKR